MEDSSVPESTANNHLLPAETVDNIIDHLHDDVATLSTSSLVCRAWLPSCRYHLFENVHCHPASATRTLSHLLEWLLASPDTHPYIKTITVSALDIPLPEICVEDVEKILLCLPLLQGLVLRQISLSWRHASDAHTSYVSSTNGPRRLRTFVIDHCEVSNNSFHPLFRALGLFSEVDDLKIKSLTFSWDPQEAGMSSSRLLELAQHFKVCRMLMLTDLGDKEMICYLLEHAADEDRWPVQVLGMVLSSPLAGGFVARIVRHCRQTLQAVLLVVNASIVAEVLGQRAVRAYLRIFLQSQIATDTIPISYHAGPADYWSTLSFYDCPRLTAMQMFFMALDSDPELEPRMQLDIRVAVLASNAELVRRAPLSLESLMLWFGGETSDLRLWEEPELASGWQSMDEALTGLPALKTIYALFPEVFKWVKAFPIAKCGEVPMAVVEKETAPHEAFLTRVLPRSYARGIVYVAIHESS